ncbi:dihydrolipoyl dehydrogenase family protein [Maribacter sp. 2210JD10-5]|uniref:dihydrolipoyl dehydrogenase family protein n=1 Tax=Maribacter sp. 2210JD10-5 TaxID=3386272 RepID=UPI0039BD2FD8
MEEFDVFVIGSGVAGQTVAKACADKGKKVAIADRREFGGTCANRGCDPKKVLLGVTEIWEEAQNLKGKGIEKLPELNWKKLQKYKRSFTKAIPAATEKNLKKKGISLYHQSPEFVDERTLKVEGKTAKAKNIVIATGYEPRKLSFKGSKHLSTSDDFLNLKKLPKSIIFIGAGYVGMEFAHMAARFGVRVTVLDSGNRPLSAFDADLVGTLTDYSKKLGIKFIFNSEVKAVEKLRKNFRVSYKSGKKMKSLTSKMVINTAGRIPAISALNLEKGNVAFNENGIATNNFLQSETNPGVYACGDVSDNGLPLTPLSGREGYVVSENILNGNRKKLSIPVIPSVVFTLPNIASVGYSEKEAKSRFKNIIVKQASALDWFNAKRINAPAYSYKIILNERTQKLVGAHILGPNAGETINIFAMAIHKGMKADELQSMLFTYPSLVNDIKNMV